MEETTSTGIEISLSGETAINCFPICFFPSFKIAIENGLLYSTLQQDEDTCPNFGIGVGALSSATKCEPSGILLFYQLGLVQQLFVYLHLQKHLLIMIFYQ